MDWETIRQFTRAHSQAIDFAIAIIATINAIALIQSIRRVNALAAKIAEREARLAERGRLVSLMANYWRQAETARQANQPDVTPPVEGMWRQADDDTPPGA